MSKQTIGLSPGLYDYFLSVSLKELPLLARLREETAQDPMAQMQIAPEQGQFMSLLIRLLGARKALEIGVYTGYSSLITALALPEDGRIVACDISEEWTQIARRYWAETGVSHKIDLRLAPAVETLDHLVASGEAGTFDFAFIDADKQNYESYYEKAFQLVRRGGLIAIDNTLWSGRVADPDDMDPSTRAVREFNEMLSADSRVEMTLVPIADGLTLVRKPG